ncbi:MAG: hypothetical protein J5746_12935 [Victivallales bacterium]|nr:hypothetical protein [Victivallales bacterium]
MLATRWTTSGSATSRSIQNQIAHWARRCPHPLPTR